MLKGTVFVFTCITISIDDLSLFMEDLSHESNTEIVIASFHEQWLVTYIQQISFVNNDKDWV